MGTGNLDSAAQGEVSISPVDCQRLSVYLRKMQEGHGKIRSNNGNSIVDFLQRLVRSAHPTGLCKRSTQVLVFDRVVLVGVLDYAGI